MFKKLLPLALATFAVGTDAFVIAGLLPDIAASLKVSVPAAGQLVTAFALTYALAAPVMGALTGRLDRRTALLLALAIFIVGNIATATATDYPTAMAARVITAIGAGAITPVAAATATAVAPAEKRGQALSIVVGGLTVSTALGVPLGTLIGGTDWRLTLWAVAGLSVIAVAGIAAGLPRITLPPNRLRDRLAPLRQPAVLVLLATTGMILAAGYTFYAYIGPITHAATGGSTVKLTAILLAYGIGGVIGNFLAGRLSDRFTPERVLTVTLIVYIALATLTPLTTTHLWLTLPWVTAWSATGWGTTVPQQSRLVSLAPQSSTILLGLNSSALYLGTAAGGGIGGIALGFLPAPTLGLLTAALAALALVTVVLTTRTRPTVCPIPTTG